MKIMIKVPIKRSERIILIIRITQEYFLVEDIRFALLLLLPSNPFWTLDSFDWILEKLMPP